MDRINEEQVERYLKTLTSVQPSPECQKRAIENARRRLRPDGPTHAPWKWTAAAVLLLGIGLCFVERKEGRPPRPAPQSQTASANPMSLYSLNRAYDTGGLDAVEQIFDRAAKQRKPRPGLTWKETITMD